MVVVLGIDIGLRNLAVCELEFHVSTKTYGIKKWINIDILSYFPHCKTVRDVKDSDYHLLGEWFISELYTPSYIRNNIHHIAIERQPSGRTSSYRMNIFSHILYQRFVQLRFKIRSGCVLSSVRFVGGNCKYNKNWLATTKLTKAKTYKGRKTLSIHICQYFLTQYHLTFPPTRTAKMDDVADAFLLALYIVHFGCLH